DPGAVPAVITSGSQGTELPGSDRNVGRWGGFPAGHPRRGPPVPPGHRGAARVELGSTGARGGPGRRGRPRPGGPTRGGGGGGGWVGGEEGHEDEGREVDAGVDRPDAGRRGRRLRGRLGARPAAARAEAVHEEEAGAVAEGARGPDPGGLRPDRPERPRAE